MADPDFEEQLKQEQLAKEGTEQGGLTRVEEDGTVMEWDSERRAWFPKIDDDFIAKYQMTYGTNTSEQPSQESAGTNTYSEDYYRDYYNYYNYYYQNAEQPELTSNDGTNQEPADKSDATRKNLSSAGSGAWSGHDFDHYFEQYKEPGSEVLEQCPEMIADQNSAANNKKKKKGKVQVEQPKREEGWFEVEEDKNTNVYVSGLPTDITDDEFTELMNKFGLIMFDPFTKQPKVKLYKDENGEPKGDGRCCYIKVESVNLAIQLLHESELRGKKVHVERAQFQMKGNFDPRKKRRRLNNKEKRKYREKQAKLFDWRPEKQAGTRFKFEKIVIFKNMFDPKDFEENPLLINELRDDIRTECSTIGDVRKITLYDRHPDGVLSVAFKDAEMADECVEKMNHRWFAKRRIICQTWDGVTKYEIEETEAERDSRLKKWENFLDSGEDVQNAAAKLENTKTEKTGMSDVQIKETGVTISDLEKGELLNKHSIDIQEYI